MPLPSQYLAHPHHPHDPGAHNRAAEGPMWTSRRSMKEVSNRSGPE